eukprot:2270821-Alexandrium_andersonii.AAC.1
MIAALRYRALESSRELRRVPDSSRNQFVISATLRYSALQGCGRLWRAPESPGEVPRVPECSGAL